MTDDHDSPITHNGRAERTVAALTVTFIALIGIAIWIGVVT